MRLLPTGTRSIHVSTSEFNGACIKLAIPISAKVMSTLPATDATAPSQLFPGLSLGAILCRPKARPK